MTITLPETGPLPNGLALSLATTPLPAETVSTTAPLTALTQGHWAFRPRSSPSSGLVSRRITRIGGLSAALGTAPGGVVRYGRTCRMCDSPQDRQTRAAQCGRSPEGL